MSQTPGQYDELVALLRERGHDSVEIERILADVREYDRSTQTDSVMEAIATGEVDLDVLIAKALKRD